MKLVSPLILLLAVGSTALAGPRENAYKIYNRIAGVPPTKELLDTLEQDMKKKDGGTIIAKKAMETETFLSVFLRDMITPWSNEARKLDFPLTDFTATMIGYIKDGRDFSGILSEDIVYTHPGSNAPYNIGNNSHYEQIESSGLSLQGLTPVPQSSVSNLREKAGILTTYGWASQYYFDGTNRAPVAETLETFLCYDIDSMKDITRSDEFVRQDVPRKPGGSEAVYLNTCSGCHAGMDPLSKAFSYVDWIPTDPAVPGIGQFLMDTPSADPEVNSVRPKMTRNNFEFPNGYRISDDKWENKWIEGSNEGKMGFRGETNGQGLASWGTMMADSAAFDRCMPKKVVEHLCEREVDTAGNIVEQPTNDEKFLMSLAKKYKSSDYDVREVIAEVAATCIVRDKTIKEDIKEDEPDDSE